MFPNITSLVSTSGRLNRFILTVSLPVEFLRSLTEFELDIFRSDEHFVTRWFSFVSCAPVLMFTPTSAFVPRGRVRPGSLVTTVSMETNRCYTDRDLTIDKWTLAVCSE